MSEKVLCEKSDLVAIADAVREATGNAENYNVSELSAATVEAISTGGGSGGSGGTVVTGNFSYSKEMSAPGAYTYTLESDSLLSSTRNVVVVYLNEKHRTTNEILKTLYCLFLRNNKTESFEWHMVDNGRTISSCPLATIDEDKIELPDVSTETDKYYVLYRFSFFAI